MQLSDLIDLLWWLLKQEDRSKYIFDRLQNEIRLKMHSMKDTDILMFLKCFTENSSDFSLKLLKTTVSVMEKKLTKFTPETLVGIIWSFSRLNLQADDMVENIFVEIKDLIKPAITKLSEKNLAMLLWSFTRVESLDQTFLEILKAAVTGKNKPYFDNFDLLLIVQACKLFEGSFLKDDKDFVSTTMVMLGGLEAQVSRELPNMNIHEFLTVSTYYLMHNIGSSTLVNLLKNKVVAHIEEFDEVQLVLIMSALQANTLGDHEYLIDTIKKRVKDVQNYKVAEVNEEVLRKLIREKLIALRKQREERKIIDEKLGIKDIKSIENQSLSFHISFIFSTFI